MTKTTILKTASVLALAGSLFVGSAAAEHRDDGLGYAISQVERATDALFNDYKRELQHQGLWKPRGGYSTLYSAIFRMEDYGDSLRKYYEKRVGLHALARVAARIDQQVHLAEEVAPHLRLSRRIHAGIRQVSAATHALTGVCQGGGDRYDPRRPRQPRWDDRDFNRRDRGYQYGRERDDDDHDHDHDYQSPVRGGRGNPYERFQNPLFRF